MKEKLKPHLIPLFTSVLVLLPWYLFAKYILGWRDVSETLCLIIFLFLYFPLFSINVWKQKSSQLEDSILLSEKIAKIFGKGFLLMVLIQFVVVLVLLLIVLFQAGGLPPA